MKDLFDSIVSVFEFLLQGSFACLLTWYLVSLVHVFSHSVVRYAKRIWSPLFESLGGKDKLTGRRDHDAPPHIWALTLSALYAWGILSNAFNYWLLRPMQGTVIHGVIENTSPLGESFVENTAEAILVPFRRTNHWVEYDSSMVADVKWRNQNREAHDSALGHLLKFVRIVRGALVTAVVVFWIALSKVVVSSLTLLIGRFRPRWASSMFVHLVNHRVYRRRSAATVAQLGRRLVFVHKYTWRRMLVPNLLILMSSLVLVYWATMTYKSTECEYQELAFRGAASATTAPHSSKHPPDP